MGNCVTKNYSVGDRIRNFDVMGKDEVFSHWLFAQEKEYLNKESIFEKSVKLRNKRRAGYEKDTTLVGQPLAIKLEDDFCTINAELNVTAEFLERKNAVSYLTQFTTNALNAPHDTAALKEATERVKEKHRHEIEAMNAASHTGRPITFHSTNTATITKVRATFTADTPIPDDEPSDSMSEECSSQSNMTPK